MAEIQENNNKEKKGNKQKKMNIRVDFTPMVDMNMLLITFFMLCTSLSKPQTMEISMPSNDKNITEEQQNKVKASQALTLLLGEDGKLYGDVCDDVQEVAAVTPVPGGVGLVTRAMLLSNLMYCCEMQEEAKSERYEMTTSSTNGGNTYS